MKQDSTGLQQVLTPDDLGEAVRRHRKTRGLTQGRLAGLANVSIGFLSDFENGKPTAEIGKILNTLRALGLNLHVAPRGVLLQALKERQ